MSNLAYDPYHRLKQLGQGSFGRVLLVRDTRDQELYVMKEVDLVQFGAKGKKEALKEVAFLNQLRHPFIVNYKEFFEKAPATTAAGSTTSTTAGSNNQQQQQLPKGAVSAGGADPYDTSQKHMLFIVMEVRTRSFPRLLLLHTCSLRCCMPLSMRSCMILSVDCPVAMSLLSSLALFSTPTVVIWTLVSSVKRRFITVPPSPNLSYSIGSYRLC